MLPRSRVAAAIVAIACSASCSKDSPTTPTGPRMWNLTGTVTRAETGSLVAGATVEILDGPNANRSTATTLSGIYTFNVLQEGSFSVRVRHSDYAEMTQTVNLTADRVLDFKLTEILRADLVREGVLTHFPIPPTSWDFHGHGVNRGDGCATAVAGTVRLLTALGGEVPGSSRSFTLSNALIVRPLERFDYSGCCFTTGELDLTASHQTTFTWAEASCP